MVKNIVIKLDGRLKAQWNVIVNNAQSPFNCKPAHIQTGAITTEIYWFANEGLFLSKLKKTDAINIISLYPHDEGVEELMNMITPTAQLSPELFKAVTA